MSYWRSQSWRCRGSWPLLLRLDRRGCCGVGCGSNGDWGTGGVWGTYSVMEVGGIGTAALEVLAWLIPGDTGLADTCGAGLARSSPAGGVVWVGGGRGGLRRGSQSRASFTASVHTGWILHRNCLLRRVSRPEPCTCTVYCALGCTILTMPVLSHRFGAMPCWFWITTGSPITRGGGRGLVALRRL